MTRQLTTALILFSLVALPAAAQAGGIIDINITGIFGCYGNVFGSTCVTDQKMLFTTIACKVMKTIDAAIIPIYCNITQSPTYTRFLDALLVLYVVIFGIGFVIGTNQTRLGVVLLGVIKVSIIYAILTNAGLFFNLIYKTAIDTPKEFVQTILTTAEGPAANNIFEYVDKGMYRIFDEVSQPELNPEDRQSFVASQLSIFAIAIGVKTLIPGGNFVYGLFIFVVMGWLFSYLMVVVRYLLAYLALTFMLMLAPIFIPSLLFKKTSFLFDEWLRMLISFVIEIVLVVAYVIMIEPFYTTFFDMLQKSFNNLKLETGETNFLKPYNTGTDKEYLKEESVESVRDPVPAMNAAGFEGDATEISADVIINLMTMAVIIFLSSVFLRYIPTLASMLAGKYNFSKLFGGEQFAQKASSAGRTNLFGQSGYAGKTDATTPDSDKPGGIWGDFSSQFRL